MSITIVLPCFNVEKYISRCIDSILNQTLDNDKYFIIAINDGSTDQTLAILNKYQTKYPNMIKVIDKKNEGQGTTKNLGLQLTKTEFVMFIDSDDWIDKDYIEKLYLEAEKGPYDIVNSGCRRPNYQNKIVWQTHLKNTRGSFFTAASMWGKIYRTNFLKENNLIILVNAHGEDIIFNFQCASYGARIKTLRYIGYNWFINDDSLTRSKRDEEQIISSCKEFYRELILQSKGLDKYYLILYQMTTLLTADLNRRNFLLLKKELSGIGNKKLTKINFLKSIIKIDQGIDFKLKLGTSLFSILTLVNVTSLVKFSKRK